MKLLNLSCFADAFKNRSTTVKRLNYTIKTALFAAALLVLYDGITYRADQSVAESIQYDSDSGMVQIDRNAWDIRTGEMHNTSSIPLPANLVDNAYESSPQPVRRDLLAPNSIDIKPDVPYIFQSVDAYLNNIDPAADFTFNEDSLSMTTQFNLQQWGESHAYGEGVELRIVDGTGTEVSRESTFVRGYEVEVGPDGEALPETSQISGTYGADSTVEMRVLNIRRNGGDIQESGIYFSQDGDFVVEDLENGGDRDFNDGKYLEFSDTSGEADAVRETETVTSDEAITETELAPETRVEEIVESDVVENVTQSSDKASKVVTDWGQVVTPTAAPLRLGHASGAVTEDDELLVYDRYSSEGHIRAGSDGFRLAGQLAPLFDNPNLPPTLISGSVTFNPFAADNEAGLTGTVGLTQFLNSTHRQATDIFGNDILTPENEGTDLVEPTGLFNNRRWVGYVPAASTTEAPEDSADKLSSLLAGVSTELSAEQWGYNRTTVASGFYLSGSLTGGLGNQTNTLTRVDEMLAVATDELITRRTLNTYMTPLSQIDTVITETTSTTREAGNVLFNLNSRGELDNARFFWNGDTTTEISSQEIGRSSVIESGEEQLIDSVTQQEVITLGDSVTAQEQAQRTSKESSANFSPLMGELTLGYVLNFGNTPWTAAANTVRAELFARDTILGRHTGGQNTGWRTEVLFHPFGEVQREAYQYDLAGNLQPVYQTEAVLDESGQQVLEQLVGPDNSIAEVAVNRFLLDEEGDRIAQMVGTGQAKGPGIYFRVENMFGANTSPTISAGLQFSF